MPDILLRQIQGAALDDDTLRQVFSFCLGWLSDPRRVPRFLEEDASGRWGVARECGKLFSQEFGLGLRSLPGALPGSALGPRVRSCLHSAGDA